MPAQRLCIESSGVQTQTQKVPSNAVTDLSIARTGMGLNIYASVTSTDETRSLTTTDRSYNEDTYVLHERLYGPTRQDEFRNHSDSMGRFHCRPLQFCLPRTRYQQNFNNSKIQLLRGALDSLHWWMSPPKNGQALKVTMPIYVITTDASLSGWGAQMGYQSHYSWTTRQL